MTEVIMLCACFLVFGGIDNVDPSTIPIFSDATKSSGIDFIHSVGDDRMDTIVESSGAGVLVFDYNGDGWMDIYFLNGCYLNSVNHPKGRLLKGKLTNRLFRNKGDGTFVDVTNESGLGDLGYGMSGVAGDIDRDGDIDLFLTNYGPNKLYLNQGDGTFLEVAESFGLDDSQWGIGCALFDFNSDGHLDLYAGNYLKYDPNYKMVYPADVFPGPLSYSGVPDKLYMGIGGGRFKDVSSTSGVAGLAGRTMGVTAVDFDGDGDIDVFAANDGMENHLLLNQGDGTFENQAMLAGVAFGQNGEATSAMGPEVGDFDRDGDLDLLVPDMLYGCLYRNEGKGFFTEQGANVGMAPALGQYVSWSGNFLDANHDGFLDVFISNGNAHRMEPEEDLLFLNLGGTKMVDVSNHCGSAFQEKGLSRGSALIDFDNDGDLDIVEVQLNGPARLLRNDLKDAKTWVQFRLIGTSSNTNGYGALVKITADGQSQVQQLRSSSGYLSQSDPRLHFGLNGVRQIQRVEVMWPSGKVQVLEKLAVNRLHLIQEPES